MEKEFKTLYVYARKVQTTLTPGSGDAGVGGVEEAEAVLVREKGGDLKW
jgi:hypothetical protein